MYRPGSTLVQPTESDMGCGLSFSITLFVQSIFYQLICICNNNDDDDDDYDDDDDDDGDGDDHIIV